MSPVRPPQQYEAIADHLRASIYNGTLSLGDVLPSEAQLCEQFDSSRGPVRQAMSTLRSEGLISSGRGRRSIVLKAAETETFEAILSISSWLSSHGYTPGARTLTVARRPAPAAVAEKLEIEEGEPVVTIHRVRTADGVPVMIERQNFRMEVGRHVLNIDTDTESVHRALMANGVDLNNISRTLEVIMAPDDERELLGMDEPGPLIKLTMICRTHAGTPVEYAEYRYRTDRISLGMNNTRGNPSPLWVDVHV